MRVRLRFPVAIAALLLASLAFAVARAEPAEEAARLEALAAELRDEAKRAALIERIEALAAARRAEAADPADGATEEPFGSVADRLQNFGLELAASLSLALRPERLGQALARGLDALLAEAPPWSVLGRALLALLAGLAAEFAAWRLLAGLRARLSRLETRTAGARLLSALLTALLAIAPVAAFVGAMAVAVAALPESAGQLLLAAAFARGAAEVALRAARALLAPAAADARLVPLSDAGAARAFVWARRLTLVVACGWFASEALRALALPAELRGLLADVIGLAVFVLAVAMVLRNRAPVRDRLRGAADPTAWRARLAGLWHVFALAYLAAAFLVWAVSVEGGFASLSVASAWTVVIAAAWRLADLGVLRLTAAAAPGEAPAESWSGGARARFRRYLPAVRGGLRAVVWLAAAALLLEAWGAPLFDLLSAPAGLGILGALIRTAVVIVLLLLLWEALCLAVERYLDARDEAGELVERSARARTLLPLLRRASAFLLTAVAGLTAASEFGIDIAPLLAGVGIAGLAIGFGAQTLVKDIITGMFIVLEEQVAVGEVVTVAGHTGLVEALSIRTIRLRDLSGTVHVVPFGEVGTVENLTRDFSYAVIDAGVGYGEDTDHVTDVLCEIGAEMEADEAWRERILAPFEVLGVQELGDSAVVIRCRFRTPPLQQWAVGREFRRRMKKRFDEVGIEIPFPHRTVYFGADKPEAPAGAGRAAFRSSATPDAGKADPLADDS